MPVTAAAICFCVSIGEGSPLGQGSTPTRPYHKVLLEAVARSGRSARDISLAAVGHESAVRSLRRGLDLHVSTVERLCRELGLELRIGPPGRSSDDDKALGAMFDAIAQTWRTGTRTQRQVLLASLASSRRFVDDWIAGRLPLVEEAAVEGELQHPSSDAPDT